EVPEAPVVGARDERELSHLFRVEQPIRNRDAEHGCMPLDIQPVAESKRAELVLGQLTGEKPARLITKFSHALVNHRLVDLVVAIHGLGKYWLASQAGKNGSFGAGYGEVMRRSARRLWDTTRPDRGPDWRECVRAVL